MSIPSYELYLPEVESLFNRLSTAQNPAIAFTIQRFKEAMGKDDLNETISHDKLIRIFRICDQFALLDCDQILSEQSSDEHFTKFVSQVQEILVEQ